MLAGYIINRAIEGDIARLKGLVPKIGAKKGLPNQLAAYLEALKIAQGLKRMAWVMEQPEPSISDEREWQLPGKLKDLVGE